MGNFESQVPRKRTTLRERRRKVPRWYAQYRPWRPRHARSGPFLGSLEEPKSGPWRGTNGERRRPSRRRHTSHWSRHWTSHRLTAAAATANARDESVHHALRRPPITPASRRLLTAQFKELSAKLEEVLGAPDPGHRRKKLTLVLVEPTGQDATVVPAVEDEDDPQKNEAREVVSERFVAEDAATGR